MKFLFSLFCITIFTFFTSFAFADSLSTCSTSNVPNAQCGSSGVLIFAPGSSTATFAPPSATLSLGQLQITYSVLMTVTNTTGFTYDNTKWGVTFVGGTNSYDYYQGGTLATNVTVTPNATNMLNNGAYYAGTIVLTIDFTNAGSVLSSDIASTISSGSIKLQPFYLNSGVKTTDSSVAFNWQADTGAMLYGPSISVQAQNSAFVVNLSPPSSLNAAVANSANTQLTATANPNSLSGYIVVYWLDTDASGNSTGCRSNPGGWQFSMNPVAFATAPSGTPTTCTYTQYQTSFNTGGNSGVFGCPAGTGILPFDSTITSVSALTSDAVAIPYTPSFSNPSQIPSDSNGTPSGCYNVVYVPGSQTSWSKGNINNGDIYGVVAWALNSAYNTTTNTSSPNYSLAHSNISYITGVNIPLASLDKSPNLPLTTSDCFVVTAASGNVNSQSVFYWRIIRDEYLTPMGITPFYYQHAKNWARWLDEHPKLKPALNTFFEYSGKFIYKTSGYLKKSKELMKIFIRNLEDVWAQEAGAQELPSQSQEQKSTPPTENISPEVQSEKPKTDSKKTIKEKNKETKVSNETSKYDPYQQPRFDIFITGGVLFPTQDKVYYDKFYSSQMTSHVEGGANYIFWFGNFGLSTGLLGRYLMNSSNGSVTVLGTQQQYTLNFYSMTAEALVGLRYRNPCWSYLQPGIFAGAGVTRFREEASTGSSSSSTSSNTKPLGVTNYSPIFEFGGNLDLNLIPLFNVYPGELGDYLSDVALRFSASYNINPTPALSSTGLFVQAGFVFLLD